MIKFIASPIVLLAGTFMASIWTKYPNVTPPTYLVGAFILIMLVIAGGYGAMIQQEWSKRRNKHKLLA